MGAGEIFQNFMHFSSKFDFFYQLQNVLEIDLGCFRRSPDVRLKAEKVFYAAWVVASKSGIVYSLSGDQNDILG